MSKKKQADGTPTNLMTFRIPVDLSIKMKFAGAARGLSMTQIVINSVQRYLQVFEDLSQFEEMVKRLEAVAASEAKAEKEDQE